jgi:RNA polymerase sigma-70 factor (ECF subfamily)
VDNLQTASGQRADDTALVVALRSGDEVVFADLVDRWSPAMLRVARAHVSTVASAEEIVQDAWVGALRGLDRFEGRSSLRTWVFRILVNIATTRGVREVRTLPFSSAFGGDDEDGPTVDPDRFQAIGERYPGGWREFPADWPPSPEGQLIAGEVRQVVHRSLAALPVRQRMVMTLRDIEGYDSDEVCRLLDLAPGNQRVLLHRARAAVRRELEGYYTGGAGEVR